MLNPIVYVLTGVLLAWSLLCLCRRPLPRQPGEILRFTQPRGLVNLCLVLHGVMAVFTIGAALAGGVGGSGAVRLAVGPGAVLGGYFLLMAAAVCWPQRFSPAMQEKLLGPESGRKE